MHRRPDQFALERDTLRQRHFDARRIHKNTSQSVDSLPTHRHGTLILVSCWFGILYEWTVTAKLTASPHVLGVGVLIAISGFFKHAIDPSLLEGFLHQISIGDKSCGARDAHRQAVFILFEESLAFICSRVTSQEF